MTDYNTKSAKTEQATQAEAPVEKKKETTYTVTADRLNIRSAASAEAEVKFIANKGDKFTELSVDGEFVEVRIKDGSNRKGFAMKKFLRKA